MALLDFLKNKKEKDKAREKKAEKALATPKAQKPVEIKAEKRETKNDGTFSYEVIKEPHISEKSTLLGEKSKYVFKVSAQANKLEIKKSVEGIYNVTVLDVNMVTIPKKKRRLGRHEGFKKAHHKAIVTLKAGQKIELF